MVLSGLLLNSCGSVPSFKEGLGASDKNISFDVQVIDKPSLVTSVSGVLYIYGMDSSCKPINRGGIEFKGGNGPTKFGLVPGVHRFSIIQKDFSLLTTSIETQNLDFQIEVQAGKNYAISYVVNNKLAGKNIIEMDKTTGASKEVFGTPWKGCER